MDEGLIRALVVGGALGTVGIVATLVWQLIRSPSKSARRTRLVLGLLLGGFLMYAIVAGPNGDRPFFIGVAATLAAAAFIMGGAKK